MTIYRADCPAYGKAPLFITRDGEELPPDALGPSGRELLDEHLDGHPHIMSLSVDTDSGEYSATLDLGRTAEFRHRNGAWDLLGVPQPVLNPDEYALEYMCDEITEFAEALAFCESPVGSGRRPSVGWDIPTGALRIVSGGYTLYRAHLDGTGAPCAGTAFLRELEPLALAAIEAPLPADWHTAVCWRAPDGGPRCTIWTDPPGLLSFQGSEGPEGLQGLAEPILGLIEAHTPADPFRKGPE